MTVLSFSIEANTANDLGSVAENTKTYCAMFDGVRCPDCWIELASVTEATAKTSYKTHLTAVGYTWDSEV